MFHDLIFEEGCYSVKHPAEKQDLQPQFLVREPVIFSERCPHDFEITLNRVSLVSGFDIPIRF